MYTIKDVAKLAGVSIGTVSNVINNSRRVSPEKRELVQKAIEELHFTINPIASSLKGKYTNTIGVVATDITRVFYSHIITGMQKAADAKGYTLSILSTYNSVKAEKEAIARFISSKVDAIVINTSANMSDIDYFVNLYSLHNKDKHIPVFSIEINLSQFGISSIFIDGLQASENATDYLIGKGCKKIIHLQGPRYSSLSLDRLIGYKKALAKNGLPIEEENITTGNFSQHSGYECINALLKKGISFDGIFSANDQMAVGACQAVLEHHLRIPEDVKIVGFDNSFVASIVSPSLTTIDVPKEEMGYQAIENVINMVNIKKGCQPMSICLPTELVIRETTDKNVSNRIDSYDW